MRPSRIDDIRKFIQKQPVCRISDILEKFKLTQSRVSQYLTELGVLRSYNHKRKYCIFPQGRKFDERGLLFIGEVSFFEGGKLLDAICHLVQNSPAGLGARELDEILKTTTHSQLPTLFRNGRLQRDSAEDRPGNAFIYFSPDRAQSELQRKALAESKKERSQVEEVNEEPLAAEELPDAIEVLLTLIKHPDFSAKSISLSLQRRGKVIGQDFVARAFQQYGLSKKNS